MTRIMLTESQAQAIQNAGGPVEICDPAGQVITIVTRPQSEKAWIEEALRRRDQPGPRLATSEVLEYRQSLKPTGS